jgi:thioesterase domain-containing protein
MEVASMMRRRGAEVEIVILLDTILPRGRHRNWLKWCYNQAAEIKKGNATKKLVGKLQNSLLGRRVRSRSARETINVDEAFELRQAAFYQAIGTWETNNLMSDFPVILFRASKHSWGSHIELDEDYGWRHYLRGPLRVLHVSGDHLGIIRAPNVAELGRNAQKCLRAK